MHTLRIRFTGNESHVMTLTRLLSGMDGVGSVKALPPYCQASQRPCGATAERKPPTICNLEVDAADISTARRIRIFAAGAAEMLDSSAEFVERF